MSGNTMTKIRNPKLPPRKGNRILTIFWIAANQNRQQYLHHNTSIAIAVQFPPHPRHCKSMGIYHYMLYIGSPTAETGVYMRSRCGSSVMVGALPLTFCPCSPSGNNDQEVAIWKSPVPSRWEDRKFLQWIDTCRPQRYGSTFSGVLSAIQSRLPFLGCSLLLWIHLE